MKDCELYPQFTLDHMRNFWIAKYCEAEFDACARLTLVKTGKTVPATLLPNGKDLHAAIRG
jgi:hypothetical protein